MYLVGGSFLGPGVSDYSVDLIGGYTYSDAGHYEKQILFSGKGVVIDSRVDNYVIAGHIIYVARRPREIYKENNVISSRLSNACEYWSIDTRNKSIQIIDSYPALGCR